MLVILRKRILILLFVVPVATLAQCFVSTFEKTGVEAGKIVYELMRQKSIDVVLMNSNSTNQNTASKQQFMVLQESNLIVILFVIILIILLLLVYLLYKNYLFRDKTYTELKEAYAELQFAKERAEEASQLKTQFVATVSHELRTPLYGVIGITNIILDEHKELVNSPHLNSLKFSARYLLALVNDLLQINKIEDNKVILESMIFNIPDEINSILDSLEFIALKNNNKLSFKLDPNIPEFLIGDKLRLAQVFMNLVSNALKFTKNGVVEVSAQLDYVAGTYYYIHFSVADTGIGIAPDDQQKIFEKFVQI